MIRAACLEEATPASGYWVFVDLGFARSSKSCGLLAGTEDPRELTFAELTSALVRLVSDSGEPINLVIEAPLSVAFNLAGNPTGRSIEKRGGQTRYWYVGLGCCVLVAATYLVRALVDSQPKREIRLFEGLVSFKPKGVASSHAQDVRSLRDVIFSPHLDTGRVIAPHQLAMSNKDRIESAFAVAGMDFGIPPVVSVES